MHWLGSLGLMLTETETNGGCVEVRCSGLECTGDVVFTQCSYSVVEPRRWVKLSRGVSLTCVYTVISLTEQTPQVGQNEQAQVCGKDRHIAGTDSAFHLHTQKKQCGVEPYNFGRAQKAGQNPRSGAGLHRFAFTPRGKMRVCPRMWGLTPQSGHCVNVVLVGKQLATGGEKIAMNFPAARWYDS